MPRALARTVGRAEVWSSVLERVVCECCNGRRQQPGRECHLRPSRIVVGAACGVCEVGGACARAWPTVGLDPLELLSQFGLALARCREPRRCPAWESTGADVGVRRR